MKRGCDLIVFTECEFTECELTRFFLHWRIEELNKFESIIKDCVK